MALDIGLTVDAFWAMSLRDLSRCVDAHNRRERVAIDRDYLVAAAHVCEIVNILGSAYSAKDSPWQMMRPIDFYNNWTGQGSSPDVDQDYVEQVLAGIKAREAAVTFMGQNKEAQT